MDALPCGWLRTSIRMTQSGGRSVLAGINSTWLAEIKLRQIALPVPVDWLIDPSTAMSEKIA
ncbi:MAG: hypothetical protein JSR90_01090 [Proteobacteria bacterium]|nr:hypothetical protein [Pseudomonadota bacterium]